MTRWDFFQHEKELSPENFQRDAFYYKDTLDDTRNLHGFYFHIYTHTHTMHAATARARAPVVGLCARYVFVCALRKISWKRRKCVWLTSFWTPSSRLASLPNVFFLSSLSYSLSSLSISTMMIVVARKTRKIFALGGSPARSIVDIDYVVVRSSKRRNRERKRELKGVVSRVVSSSKKKNCSLSRLKMFDFFDVSNARERKRGASFFEIRRKEREREGPNSWRKEKKKIPTTAHTDIIDRLLF